MFNKRWALVALFILIGAVVLAACAPQTETVTVEVTRVVTETVEVEGEAVEVTVVVVETIIETVEVEAPEEEMVAGTKDLIVCMAQEPGTLYPPGGNMLAESAVQHAIWTANYTSLTFDYQAQGLTKLPSLADGDAVVNLVEAAAGDIVVGSDGEPVTLEDGVEVNNADGETVVFDGTPVMMEQMVVDYEIVPRKWSDGEEVTSDDYVFTYEIYADPDTPRPKFAIDRTAVYEATGDYSLRWTGIPGFLDSTYFLNYVPGAPLFTLPEHLLSGFTAAELIEAEESSRLPVGDGAFKVVEWIAGDSILMEPNEFFWGADQGLPYLDSLTYKFIPDTNQLLAQLLAGACDIGTQDAALESNTPFLIEAENGGLLTPYFQTGTVWEHIDFGVNPIDDYASTRPDWFEDVRVRQAMTMCTDRQSMVDNIFYGRSEVIHSYIPSVHPLYADGLTEYPYDPEAGNALLEEAGFVDTDGDGVREFPAGTPFAPTLGTTSGSDARSQLTQIFKENLIECGVDVQLYYLPPSEWFADGPDGPLFGRRFDLGEFAWLTGVEPGCDLYLGSQIVGPENGWSGNNETGWSNEAYDVACNQALGSLPGTDSYVEAHAEAQRIFSQELPVIPLYLRIKAAAARPEVLNFGIDPTENSELYNIYQIDLQQ